MTREFPKKIPTRWGQNSSENNFRIGGQSSTGALYAGAEGDLHRTSDRIASRMRHTLQKNTLFWPYNLNLHALDLKSLERTKWGLFLDVNGHVHRHDVAGHRIAAHNRLQRLSVTNDQIGLFTKLANDWIRAQRRISR